MLFSFGIILYLILYLLIFFRISKINKSYLNSFTISMGYVFLLQGVGLLLASFKADFNANYSGSTLFLFVASLIIGIVMQFTGYVIGFKSRVKVGFINRDFSPKQTRNILNLSVVGMVASFLILGILGIGVREWIFNTRYAYIVGRAGNGVFYVFFEIFCHIAIIVAMFYKIKFRKKGLINVVILFLLFATYFTGSKGFILSTVLSIIFFYDMFYKKIRFRTIIVLGVVGIIAISILLKIQSNITIIDYINGDFYNNYLNEIQAINDGAMPYYYGQLTMEDSLYSFLPRSIFVNKPFVYGTSRLPAFFFGEETVIQGNTPSFSAYGTAYADLGLFGVAIQAFLLGLFSGICEGILRRTFLRHGAKMFAMIAYALLFTGSMPISQILVLVIVYIGYIVCAQLYKKVRLVRTSREKGVVRK